VGGIPNNAYLGLSADSVFAEKLLIIDSLNCIASTESIDLANVLSSFIGPTTSLLAVYHTDVPLSNPHAQSNAYIPTPLTLLKYLATTIFITHSLHHVLARKAARDRSHVEPTFGLEAGVEGVLQGLGSNGRDGLVLEMEHRRKSGRGVREWYVMPLRTASVSSAARSKEVVMLLEDYPAYRGTQEQPSTGDVDGLTESTFELGLTAKQRQDREGVVLPYLDAQKGGGDGGRILYDMGSEDDFDEEEDEI